MRMKVMCGCFPAAGGMCRSLPKNPPARAHTVSLKVSQTEQPEQPEPEQPEPEQRRTV